MSGIESCNGHSSFATQENKGQSGTSTATAVAQRALQQHPLRSQLKVFMPEEVVQAPAHLRKLLNEPTDLVNKVEDVFNMELISQQGLKLLARYPALVQQQPKLFLFDQVQFRLILARCYFLKASSKEFATPLDFRQNNDQESLEKAGKEIQLAIEDLEFLRQRNLHVNMVSWETLRAQTLALSAYYSLRRPVPLEQSIRVYQEACQLANALLSSTTMHNHEIAEDLIIDLDKMDQEIKNRQSTSQPTPMETSQPAPMETSEDKPKPAS